MAVYTLESGKVVDTKKAKHEISEGTRHDGNNNISLATGAQWEHETLFLSKKGTWYKEVWSQWQGSGSYAVEMSAREASEWLALNEKDPEKYGLENVAE